MFGYVKPFTPELKVRDYELYKAFYCGLCKATGARVCRSARLTLSYDLVFLAIVRAAVSNEEVTIKRKRCAVHPIKKRPVAYCENALPYAARASALLTYYKVADDAADEKGLRRFLRRLSLPYAKRLRKKADLGELDREIAQYIEKLGELEAKNAGPEECADEFGRTLGSVFAHAFGDETSERVLYEFGRHVGRWIYFTDAANDLEGDRKKGRFNPFAAYDPFPREEISDALLLELDAAHGAIALMSDSDPRLTAVIENVLVLGMPDAAEKVFKRITDKETEND